jgi:predicted nucleic acid-binding protein
VIAMNPEITGKRLVLLLQRLRFLSEYFPTVSIKFESDRDPDDSKFIELAIIGGASHIVTHDHDLLSLKDQHTPAAKRFRQRLPNAKIMTPPEFLSSLGLDQLK